MTKDELFEVIAKAKEAGITRLKTDEFEICFDAPKQETKQQEAIVPELDEKSKEALFKTLSMDSELTSEELKYYATPYFDELMALKEDQKAEGAKENVNN